jgi:hypothetical protein
VCFYRVRKAREATAMAKKSINAMAVAGCFKAIKRGA